MNDKEYAGCYQAVSKLAKICGVEDPGGIVDMLTGYLWDEEDAGMIKADGQAEHTKGGAD